MLVIYLFYIFISSLSHLYYIPRYLYNRDRIFKWVYKVIFSTRYIRLLAVSYNILWNNNLILLYIFFLYYFSLLNYWIYWYKIFVVKAFMFRCQGLFPRILICNAFAVDMWRTLGTSIFSSCRKNFKEFVFYWHWWWLLFIYCSI